jgi:8-oxo-dGTP pyrophosphatase MutT (NUDIX family)
MQIDEKTRRTLVFLLKEGEVLLAMKKRRFGAGKWNGLGGKLEPGESVHAAAVRECQEEAGVTPEELQEVAEIKFHYLPDPNDSNMNVTVSVFTATNWLGDPIETEEMRPAWFKFADVPYHSMWQDDQIWLPFVLRGQHLKADFSFGSPEQITKAQVEVLV